MVDFFSKLMSFFLENRLCRFSHKVFIFSFFISEREALGDKNFYRLCVYSCSVNNVYVITNIHVSYTKKQKLTQK